MSAEHDLVSYATSQGLANSIGVASSSLHARRLLEHDAQYERLLGRAAHEATGGNALVDAVRGVAAGTIETLDPDTALLALLTALVHAAPTRLTRELLEHAEGTFGPYAKALALPMNSTVRAD